jgi:hypothetical protein
VNAARSLGASQKKRKQRDIFFCQFENQVKNIVLTASWLHRSPSSFHEKYLSNLSSTSHEIIKEKHIETNDNRGRTVFGGEETFCGCLESELWHGPF